MPSATGLRRTGAGAGLSGLDRINRRIVATHIRQTGTTAHPLDIDAIPLLNGNCFAQTSRFASQNDSKIRKIGMRGFQSRNLGRYRFVRGGGGRV
jgi:hypothetical protein